MRGSFRIAATPGLHAGVESLTRNSPCRFDLACEASDQDCGEGHLQPCQGGFDGGLELLGEAPGAVDPAKGPLHQPAFWQNDEALDFLVGSFDDYDVDAACFKGDPPGLVACIAAIDKGHFHPRTFAAQRSGQRCQGISVLHIGGAGLARDGQPKRIDGDMPLAALPLAALD